MILNIYLSLEIIALIMLLLSLIPFNNRKQWMPAAAAMMIFFYLALSSANLVIPKNDVVSENTSIELVEHLADYTCSGTPNNCDVYDLNQPYCELAGCTYNETTTLCSGTPTDCIDLSAEFCPLANCDYARGQSTYENETIIRYSYACSYCTYKDIPQMWFNMGLAFISLIVTIGLMILKKANDW